ncbi:hypothetical protein B0O99DRAFT_694027 [Bisporella sp. PMI_857]|nr:hypothetical protein B0O99DRAFT_694027 [Bisporella sp. PMI_857]
MSTLLQCDQTIGLQGSLTSHTGQLLVRLGKSYEIPLHDEPFNDWESAWAAENAANGMATLNDFTEAVRWQELARDHWLKWSNRQETQTEEWPACIKKSMGMTLVWGGWPDRARVMVADALDQIEYGTHFALGTVDRYDRDLESAEAHFMEARNLWLKGDQLRTDPFSAARMYRMGCIALDQGKMEAAAKHPRDSLAVTEIQEATLIAEHARCIFKLSEVLEQDPRGELEARSLREEAESLLLVRNPSATILGSDNAYDSLVNILWR